jgi:hypothetical protein
MRLSRSKTKTRRRVHKKMKMTKRKLIVKKTTRRLRLKNKNKRKTRRYVGGGGLDLFGIKRRREAKEEAAFEKWNEAKKDKQMSNENKWAEENKDRNEQKKICKNIPKRIKEINERIASIEATLIPINEKMAAEDLNRVDEDGSEILDDKQKPIKLTIKGQYNSNLGEWYDEEDHDFPVSLNDFVLSPYDARVRTTDLTTYNYYKPTAIELNNERNKLSKELDSLAKEKENLENEKESKCKDLFDDNIEEAESWNKVENKVECPYIEDELKHINKEIQKIDDRMNEQQSFGKVKNSAYEYDDSEDPYTYITKSINDLRKEADSGVFDNDYANHVKKGIMMREGQALDKEKETLLKKKEEKEAEFEQRKCVLNALSSESNTDPDF